MLSVERPQDLKAHVGEDLGVSDWLTVDQERINTFAEASGDHQWIHVDVERCKKEMPDGKTIAHGNLTLSLVSTMLRSVYEVRNRSRGLNYGSNRVRFTNVVPVGSRIRARPKLKSVEDVAGNGVRVTTEVAVEIEGQEKPALVAEMISISYA